MADMGQYSYQKKEVLIMKRTITFILAAITLLALSACQTTPDAKFIVQKDAERMVEQAADQDNGTQLEDVIIPDSYTYESTGADGRLYINVDASIETPNSGVMPIIRVSKGGFSQETVTGIFNYLFPDEKPYSRITVQTKADIEDILINMRKQLADGSYKDNDYTEEEYEVLIADMKAQYEAAPETAPEQTVSDGTMKISQENGGIYMLDVATDTAKLQVICPTDTTSQGTQADTGGLYSYSINYRNNASPEYNTLGITRTDGTDIPDDAKNSLTISYNDAKEICDKFFEAAGMSEDFCVGSSFIVDDRGTGLSGGSFVDGKYVEGPKEPAENYAYQFYYTRKVGDIPVAVNARDGGSSGDGFSIPWYYEYVCLTVDDDGIAKVSWTDPISVGETVQENAILKSFNQITNIFETMIISMYEADIDTYYDGQAQMEVDVDDIQLCLLCTREQNADDTAGLLVPAWIFYGHNIAINDEDNNIVYDSIGGGATVWPQAPIVLLAINAVDGSTIDIAKGY